MKNTFLFVLFAALIFVFSACEPNTSTNRKSNTINFEKEKAQVAELLDQLSTSTESGNLDIVEKIWCPKEETMLIGTENNEKLVGWKQIKKAISNQSTSFKETLISITEQNIWIDEDGRTAWFFEELNYNFILHDKAMSFEGIRFTGVFVKSTEDEWKLVQGHMSVPTEMDVE